MQASAAVVTTGGVKSGALEPAIRVGDQVHLRFGGLGGLNSRSVPFESLRLPWRVTAAFRTADGKEAWSVECVDQSLPCNAYWAEKLSFSLVTRTDLAGGPRDPVRDSFRGFCGM